MWSCSHLGIVTASVSSTTYKMIVRQNDAAYFRWVVSILLQNVNYVLLNLQRVGSIFGPSLDNCFRAVIEVLSDAQIKEQSIVFAFRFRIVVLDQEAIAGRVKDSVSRNLWAHKPADRNVSAIASGVDDGYANDVL